MIGMIRCWLAGEHKWREGERYGHWSINLQRYLWSPPCEVCERCEKVRYTDGPRFRDA